MLSSQGGRGGWLIEATDCGAGVGRTSEALLLRFAERVDLVEQSRKLLNVAKESIGPLALRRAFEEPLQVRLFAYPLVFFMAQGFSSELSTREESIRPGLSPMDSWLLAGWRSDSLVTTAPPIPKT